MCEERRQPMTIPALTNGQTCIPGECLVPVNADWLKCIEFEFGAAKAAIEAEIAA